MSRWTAGASFAVGWLILWVPIFLVAMYWFKQRAHIQPIKARSPTLVLVTDTILLLYLMSLCFQRIFVKDYPCLLNIWSGYIGTVILFNSYLWRCWTLYFNFNLTHVRLQRSTRVLDGGGDNMQNFFIRNRWMTGGAFLFKLSAIVFCLLMIPPFALSVTHTSIAQQSGDGCDLSWGPTVLAVYVALYVACFSWFSFSLRSVVDGFRIKTELKITGLFGLLAVVPWFVFNNYASDTNKNTFPFSTMFLLIAICAAFAASTIYPLYASFFGSQSTGGGGSSSMFALMSSFRIMKSRPEQFHPLDEISSNDPNGSSGALSPTGLKPGQQPERLYQILADPDGMEAFTQFLTKEFSVENIVFYNEIETLRSELCTSHTEGTYEPRAFLDRLKHIHEKYIQPSASYQVNLPDPVVKNCEAHLKHEAYLNGVQLNLAAKPTSGPKRANLPTVAGIQSTQPSVASADDHSHPPPAQNPPLDHLDQSTPTLFDDAQRTIYVLMEKDSMLRFVRSDLYKKWFDTLQANEHKKKVLREMNLA